ncbi:MAG: hypothetical protein HY287_11735 [Planctomycetes bacterium]|nr:hypothetical protein [Planctomycetota bacterium]
MNTCIVVLLAGRLAFAQADTVKNGEVAALLSEASDGAALLCPVMPDQEIDPAVYSDWNGRRVYFCCRKCKKKFDANPGRYTVELAKYQPAAMEKSRGGRPDDPLADPAKADSLAKGSPIRAVLPNASVSNRESSLVNWLGRIHPVTLHLPIGLLFGAALAELLFAWRKNSFHDHSARYCLWLAVLTGIPTGVFGWFLGGLRLSDTDVLMRWHRWLGTAAVIGLVASLWAAETVRIRRRGQSGYRVLLLITILIVSAAGYFGGAMVWGVDHLAW